MRKLKPVTAEETKEGQDSEQDDEIASDNSDQDETFELMDKSGITGMKGKKRRKSMEGKNMEKSRKKIKKLKEVEDVTKDGAKTKGKIKEKKKKLTTKGKKNEEDKDVENLEESGIKKKGKMKGKNKVVSPASSVEILKKKKRKITEENKTKKKSKKDKKEKLAKCGLDEDIGEETEQDHEQLLIEGDGIEDDESSQKLDLEITDTTGTEKITLNPKNVFQIEDLGRESDLLNFAADDSDAQRMTIQEAFANDDVVEEFVKEKADASEASKPKDLDMSLPGWGDWGGPGIDETKRRKKFTIPAKPAPPRKDNKLAHVIINEDRDKKFARNQVSWWSFVLE